MSGATSSGELRTRVMRGSLWTALHAVTSVPLAFAANAVVARQLGSAGYGSLALLTALAGLAAPATNFGVGSTVVQWGAGYHASGDVDDELALLRKSQGFHLLVQLPLLAAVLVVLGRSAGVVALSALVLSSAVQAAAGGSVLSLTIRNRSDVAARVAMATNALLQVAVVVTVLATSSPVWVWSVRTAVAAAAVVVHVPFVDRETRRALWHPSLPRDLPPGLLSFTLYTWAAGLVATLVYSRSELFIMRAFSPAQELGLFALAFGLSQQLTGPIDAVLNPLLPAVSGLLAAQAGRAREALLRAERVSSLLAGLALAAVVPPLAVLTPVIYGRDFRAAALLLVPLAFASCLQSAAHPLLAFVYARRRGARVLYINTAALVVDVVASFALIPSFGYWGAGIANVLGYLAVLVLLAKEELAAQEMSAVQLLPAVAPVGLALPLAAVATWGGAALADHGLAAVVAAALSCAVGGLGLVALLPLGRLGLDPQDAAGLVELLPRRARPISGRLVAYVCVRGTARP